MPEAEIEDVGRQRRLYHYDEVGGPRHVELEIGCLPAHVERQKKQGGHAEDHRGSLDYRAPHGLSANGGQHQGHEQGEAKEEQQQAHDARLCR